MRSLAELASLQAARHGSRAFLLHPDTGRTWTYLEMLAAADGAAALLEEHGVARGDRVAISLSNRPEYLHLFLGIARLGAVAVALQPELKSPGIASILRHCGAKLLVTDQPAAALQGCPTLAVDALRPDGRGAPLRASAPGPDEPALITYSSGTTGEPKGIVHTHGSVLAILAALQAHYRIATDYRGLCTAPLDTTFGLLSSCLSAFFGGGSLVLCHFPAPAEVPVFWRTVGRLGVRALFCGTTGLELFLRCWRPEDPGLLRGLGYVVCAGAPMSARTAQAFIEAYRVPVINHYGSNETGFICAQSVVPSERVEGSVGRPKSYRIRVVERGWGGEIELQGPGLMREYYGRPDLTHAAVEDGWYRTGDLGRMDESGNLFLLGRTRGVIIKHCRKITPADVEEVLGRHPAVLECAAMGRPDALCGERVACFVTFRPELRAESEELYRHCSALLPDDHCPDEMHVLERLPRNARGKVDVAALSDAAGSPEEPGCRLHRGLAGGRVAEEAER